MSIYSSIPIWGWIDIFFNVVVLVSLCGESHWALKWLIPTKSIGKTSVKWRRERLKKKFEFLLILGIAGEVGCLPLSLYESAVSNLAAKHAEKEAGQANERASTNELAAKQLGITLNETKIQLANAQVNLIDLQKANSPMEIGNQPNFALMLVEDPPEIQIRNYRKIPVKLRTLTNDKAHKTATDLEIAFAFFGNWILIDRSDIGEIGESGIIIGYRYDDDLSEKAAKVLMKALTAKNVPSKIMTSDDKVRFEGIPTNGVIVVVCNRPDPLNEKLMLVQAKQSELEYSPTEISMKMHDLSVKKFVVGSKEMKDAQTEHDNLALEQSNVLSQISLLKESEKNLKAEIDEAVFGTNSAFRISGLMKFDPATGSFGETIVK